LIFKTEYPSSCLLLSSRPSKPFPPTHGDLTTTLHAAWPISGKVKQTYAWWALELVTARKHQLLTGFLGTPRPLKGPSEQLSLATALPAKTRLQSLHPVLFETHQPTHFNPECGGSKHLQNVGNMFKNHC
jgi:hypothetical protein